MPATERTPLPRPEPKGDMSVEEALMERRSVREYRDSPLTLADVSQLLWAGQGITDAEGHRAAPSAGGLYPLELYLVSGSVRGLAPGVYRYHPHPHALEKIGGRDVRTDLMAAALDQACVGKAAAVLVFAAVYERTTTKYGERGKRYVHMDVGHAGENVHLQAAARHLGTVVVGAFDDARVRGILGLPANEEPLYLMPVGHP